MKAKVMTAILATIMLTMTACGTISPPIQNAVTKTTATTTAESIHDSAASSEAESSLEDEKIKTDTFIAEFFDSDISFADTSELATEAMKGCSFENEIDNSNGVNKITLKGSNWFCQYHLTHFIRTRIMQRERYDHSRAFFELPEAAHRWRCRFFC